MGRGTPWVLTAALISWSGFFLHNYADLPGQTILSPETLYPTLVYLVLIAAWFLNRSATSPHGHCSAGPC